MSSHRSQDLATRSVGTTCRGEDTPFSPVGRRCCWRGGPHHAPWSSRRTSCGNAHRVSTRLWDRSWPPRDPRRLRCTARCQCSRYFRKLSVRLLLDTHVFLWLLAEPDRLDGHIGLLAEPSNALLLSAASSWEIAIKVQLGRLDLPGDPKRYGSDRMRAIGAEPASLEPAHPP